MSDFSKIAVGVSVLALIKILEVALFAYMWQPLMRLLYRAMTMIAGILHAQ